MVGECVLLVQFHVYRQFHCCGFCVVYPPLEVCPFIRAIGCGALYAGIFRADAAGKYDAGRFLVLFVPGCVSGGYDSLHGGEDCRTFFVRTGMVRICLLNTDAARFTTL